MNTLFEQTQHMLRERKEKAESGKFNCIPLPYPHLRKWIPGLERGKYILLTSMQKIGKTKFTDYTFVYKTIEFILSHPEIKVKILYFSLEESAVTKMLEYESYLLNKLSSSAVSISELRSVDRPIDGKLLDLLETKRYRQYIDKFEEIVEFASIRDKNPTGIRKTCWDYAERHGTFNHIEVPVKDKITGEITGTKRVLDSVNPYTPEDPDEYRIVIIDNASNISPESGMTLMQSIEKVSKDVIELRNVLGYTIIFVQHQAQNKEGLDARRMNAMEPSADGLADSKKTVRDVDLMLGLYAPYKYNQKIYDGYDISILGDYFRSLSIIEDREYGAAGLRCPLFFDGMTSSFEELPPSNYGSELQQFYDLIRNRQQLL